MPILGSQSAGTKGPSSAPTSVTATSPTSTTAEVSFTAPSFSKLPITSYTVTSSPSSFTGTGASSPITVSGLSSGTTYTFTVTATNANGTSSASSASNSVTPIAPKAGYTAGGEGPSATNIIEKISLPAETRSTLAATLSANTQEAAAMSNSGVAGYVTAISNSASTTINKLVFSSDAVSTLGTTLAFPRKESGAMANSGTAGYVLGGNDSSGGGTTSAIDKIAFSNDTRTTLAATLTAPTYRNTGAMANSGTAGYAHGGNRTDDYGFTSYVDKITFSNDSKSTISATLSSINARNAAHANSGTAGYFLGGLINLTTIDKITFSSDSKSAVSGGMSTPRNYHAGFANSGTAGYAAGGNNTSGTRLSSIEKLAYSNDAVSSTSVTMASARNNPAGFADSGTL